MEFNFFSVKGFGKKKYCCAIRNREKMFKLKKKIYPLKKYHRVRLFQNTKIKLKEYKFKTET